MIVYHVFFTTTYLIELSKLLGNLLNRITVKVTSKYMTLEEISCQISVNYDLQLLVKTRPNMCSGLGAMTQPQRQCIALSWE